MTTDAQLKAIRKYEKTNVIKKTFGFNKKIDADVLARLDEVPSQLGYIKTLIRMDIERMKE